jgi:AraC family transcriptional regulator
MTPMLNAPTGTELRLPPQLASVADQVPAGGLAAWQMKRVAAHIEANLETQLHALELAAVTRLSISHFSRAFRVNFGKSPHAYVMFRRVERAKSLILSDRQIPLVEVALSCGLSDQAHLSRVFRKIVGESPGAWRRRNWWPGMAYPASRSIATTTLLQ